MKFPEKLDMLIERKGLTQGKVAVQAGLSRTAVSDMTAGRRRPYLDQGFRIARALGVSLDYLGDDAQDEPPAAESPEDRAILAAVRASGLDLEAVVRVLVEASRKAEAGPPIQTGDVLGRIERPGPAKRKKSG